MFASIVLVLSILILFFGIPINGFLILYLRKKPQNLRTALDLVIIDANIAVIIFSILIVLLLIIYTCLSPLSYFSSMAFIVILMLSGHFFLNSIFAAMLVKFIYISFGSLMLELPNKTIRKYVYNMKFLMILVSIILDNFGPIQNEPAPWSLISKPNTK